MSDSLLKHYLGVFDPKTGDLQVIEAKKMVIRGLVRSQHAPEEAMASPIAIDVSRWRVSRVYRRYTLTYAKDTYGAEERAGSHLWHQKGQKGHRVPRRECHTA